MTLTLRTGAMRSSYMAISIALLTCAANADPDALAILPLNEGAGTTALDISGKGNDGSLDNGAAYEADTADGSAFAVRFDAVNDRISLPPLDVAGSGLTLACWFKADAFPGPSKDPRLIAKATGVSSNQHVFMLGTIESGSNVRLRARVRVGGTTTTLIASSGNLFPNVYYHAAATYDGSNLRLFLDGAEVGVTPLTGAVDQAPSVPIAIGAQPPGAGPRFFDGLIDDPRIYQRALSQEELAGIYAGNQPPAAVDDDYNTDANTPLSVGEAAGVLNNDSDGDSDPMTAVLVDDVSSGSLTLNPNGAFDYTPITNFVGQDFFTYRANDGTADSNLATVTIVVGTPPTAVDDFYTTNEDQSLVVGAASGVLDNDIDTNPPADLFASVLTDPSNGSLASFSPDGSFTYVPSLHFNGEDSFTYQVEDGGSGTVASATVTITVTPVNDPPVAVNDDYSAVTETLLTVNAANGVLANDNDEENQTLSAILVDDAPNGVLALNDDGSFSYDPNPGFEGQDAFTYFANDGSENSNLSTVTITVAPAGGVVADDFNRCELNDAVWTPIDPRGDSTFATVGAGTGNAHAVITVPAGISHDVWRNGNDGARLMQSVDDEDFEIEVKFEGQLDREWKLHGILIEESPGRYLRFNFQSDATTQYVFAASLVNNRPTTYTFNPISIGNVQYMRIARTGDQWTQRWSSDGVNWQTSATFSFAMNVNAAGFVGGNAGDNPAHTVLVDYFQTTSAPIANEDGDLGAGGPFEVVAGNTGSGVVNISPNQASYGCGEIVSLEAAPLAGAVFLGWSGPVTLPDPQQNPLLIEVYEDQVWTANFSVLNETAGILSDDFNTCELDDGVWTTVNPVGDGTASLSGGGTSDARLELSVPTGVDHDLWTNGNRSVRVVQPAENLDFELEAKFDSIVSESFEMQGILVEESPGHFLRFDFQGSAGNWRLLAASVDGTTANVEYLSADMAGPSPSYLRVKREGDSWTVSYSFDGTSFVDAPSFGYAFAVSKVGVYAGNSGSSPAHTALVDYFENRALPIANEDGQTDIVGPFTLSVGSQGNGTVERSPAQASYLCGEFVTLRAVPDPGYQFVRWLGAVDGTENPTTVAMVEDKQVVAQFAEDTTPPVISNIEVIPGATSTDFRWTTNEPTTSRVDFGTTTAYSDFVEDLTPKTQHRVTVAGLEPNSSYHAQITSEDGAGFSDSSSDLPFTTVVDVSGLISDDFNSCELDTAIWTLRDPLGDGSVALTGSGQVAISVPAGIPHDIWITGNFGNQIYQTVADTDFDVEVKFESGLDTRYQFNGLVVEEDPDNFVVFGFYTEGVATYVYAGDAVVNVSSNVYADDPIGPPGIQPQFVRVRRVGDQWTLWYSLDGFSWIEVADFEYALTAATVGVWSGNAPESGSNQPAHTTLVDYFYNSFSKPAVEDGPSGPVGPFALDVTVEGPGTVDVQPNRASYSCGEIVTLSPVPTVGYQFERWSGDVMSTENPLELPMLRDRTLTAHFIQDVFPPEISDIVLTPGIAGAELRWKTSEPTTSRVDYGPTTAYGSFVEDSALRTDHVVYLTGLAPLSSYHLQISVTDLAPLTTSSSDLPFSTTGNVSEIVSDDFNACELDSELWTVSDPLRAGSAVVSGAGTGDAALLLTAPAGLKYDPFTDGNLAIRAMQASKNGDFELEVKFESPAIDRFEMQGILVEQDFGRYLRFDFQGDGTGSRILAIAMENNVETIYTLEPVAGGTDWYMRVKRVGDQFTQSYSFDGIEWVEAASFSYSLDVCRVGVFAGSTGPNPPGHTAVVDYFENRELPLIDEDSASNSGGPYVLNTTTVGDGSIAISPVQSSYACGELVTLTATPDPGFRFDRWGAGLSGFQFRRTVAMVRDLDVTAVFTSDTAGPVISDVVIVPGATSTDIAWRTDEPATSRIDFGQTTGYGSVAEENSLKMSHSLTLTGLNQAALYHAQISSTDQNGFTGFESPSDRTFMTGTDLSGIVSDDFGKCAIDPTIWTLRDPRGDSTFDVVGQGTDNAYAALSVPAGVEHDIWISGNNGAALVQPANDTDFEIEAKFESGMSERYQLQGLVAEEDLDSFVVVGFYSDGVSNYVYASPVEGTTEFLALDQVMPAREIQYLRLRREGDTWTLFYSLDGKAFTFGASFTYPLTVTRVGVWGGNAPENGVSQPPHTTFIDYFVNTNAKFAAEDQGANAPPYALTTSSGGNGSVTASPDQAGYDCAELVTLTAIPDPGYEFSGWSGDVAGTENPLVVSMTNDLTAAASFVPDATAPVIKDIVITASNTSARASWRTDDPSTSRVDYGLDTNYGATVEDLNLKTVHSVLLPGLTPLQDYHLQISATNFVNLTSQSSDQEFRTSLNLAGIKSDDFNTCALDTSIWEAVDPVGDGVIAVVGAGTGNATLELTVPAGGKHDLWEFGNNSLRVVQPTEDVDFELEAKFQSRVVDQYEMQGILVEESPNRYLRFDFQGLGGGEVRLLAAALENNVGTIFTADPVVIDTPNYLRVARSGDDWTPSYSSDGVNWTDAATFTYPLTAQTVGVYAGNTGPNPPAHTAVVDYFENSQAQLSNEDVGGGLGPFVVSQSVPGGGGVINVIGSNSFPCTDYAMVEAVPNQGYKLVGWGGDLSSALPQEQLFMVRDRAISAVFELDPDPPVISGVEIIPGATSIEVRWNTDEAATSRVDFGESTGYELGFVEDSTLVTQHSVVLTGLREGTLHHLLISSADFSAQSSNVAETTTTGFNASGLLSDDFNGCVLDQGIWTTRDPVGDSTIQVIGAGTGDAYLEISVPAGVEHDIWSTGNRGPRALQATRDEDFEVEVKFDSLLETRYQLQGIVAEQDLVELLVFGFYSDGEGTYIYAAPLNGDTHDVKSDLRIPDGAPQYMRIRREGDVWTQYYSLDGAIWTEVVTFTHSLTINQVGVWGGNAPARGTPKPAHTTLVDYFKNTAAILPGEEDDPAAGAAPYEIDVEVIGGGGTVSLDPAQADYACGEIVTLTAVPDPGFKLDGWAGDLSGSEISRDLLMVKDRAVTARFVVDTTPPVISDIQIVPGETVVDVQWRTDEPATSRLDFGPTESYGSFTEDPELKTFHRFYVEGLTPGQEYHLKIGAVDGSGLLTETGDFVTNTLVDQSGIVSDDFNSCVLDGALWQLVDPVGDGGADIVGAGTGSAALELYVPAGSSHDLWTGGNKSVRVVQPSADTDFELEVKFESAVSDQYEMQGILVEEGPGRYIRFDFQGLGSGAARMIAISLVNNSGTFQVEEAMTPGVQPLYMRVKRVGDQWTQSYSMDGFNWTAAPSFTFAMSVGKVGVYAGNTGSNPPEHTAVVDYFENRLLPLTTEDAGECRGGDGGGDPGALATLPLNEGAGTTAFDSSGNNNNGSLDNGAIHVADTGDGSSFAVRFDGLNDRISLPPLDIAGDELTLACWFKADAFPGPSKDPRLIAKATGVSANQHVFMLGTIESGSNVRLRARVRVGGTTTTVIATSGNLSTNVYYHAAVTYNGSRLRLYLNGTEVGSTPLSGAVDQAPAVPVAIGAQPPGAGNRFFDGLIDDARIYPRALSQGELAAIFGGN